MCWWPCLLHVHATNTTDLHKQERRKFEYAEKCSQCRADLDNNTHVAAHVVTYPCYCCNCCCGILSLKTTCKACNNYNKDGKGCVDYHSCMSCTSINEPYIENKLSCIFWPCCIHYQCSST